MTPDELARVPSVSDGLLQQMIDREMNAGNSDNESAFRELQARRETDRKVKELFDSVGVDWRNWPESIRKAISELLP